MGQHRRQHGGPARRHDDVAGGIEDEGPGERRAGGAVDALHGGDRETGRRRGGKKRFGNFFRLPLVNSVGHRQGPGIPLRLGREIPDRARDNSTSESVSALMVPRETAALSRGTSESPSTTVPLRVPPPWTGVPPEPVKERGMALPCPALLHPPVHHSAHKRARVMIHSARAGARCVLRIIPSSFVMV